MGGLLHRRLEETAARTAAGLPVAVIELLLRLVIPTLGPDLGASLRGSQSINVADMAAAEVRAKLNEFELLIGSPVVVLLVAEHDGVLMEWPEAVAYYDDIWYPGSDDLLLLGTGRLGFVSLSHEEELVWGEL